jgi:hypothetical protein
LHRLNARRALRGMILSLAAVCCSAGCQSEAPMDKAKAEEEVRQLNEHHQSEASNQPYIKPEAKESAP